ncbi:hypothetical protein, partial [Nonomuraea sp. NPDC050691]|uniref:hypothetical protein n=1 Tax=Nonomuraea sp. NPDC050691 TaxID=3155661 RepID=UPI0033E094D8
RVRALLRLGRAAEARRSAEALARHPDPGRRLELVGACESEHRLDLARMYCERILEEFPWHAGALERYVDVLAGLGERRAARAAARRAVRLRPEDGTLFVLLLVGHRRPEGWLRWRALRVTARALRADPDSPGLRAARLEALRDAGHLRRAEAAARAMTDRHPDAYLHLCAVAADHADRGARGHALRILDGIPSRRDTDLRRAEILLKLDRPAEAARAVAVLAESGRRDPATLRALGELFYFSEHEDHALPYLDEALRIVPHWPAPHAIKIDCLRYLYWYTDAERAARHALTLLPEEIDLWTRLVKVCGRGQEAAVVEEALAAIPGGRHGEALAALAETLDSVGEYEEAVRCRDRAIAVEPRDDLIEAQAKALRDLGRYAAARRLLRTHPRPSREVRRAMRELNTELGLHAMATAAYDDHEPLDRAERSRRRRSRWLSGGPSATIRKARRSRESALLWRWENWCYNLAQLDSLDGVTEREADAARAANEAYLLDWARHDQFFGLLRPVAAVLGPAALAGAAWAAARLRPWEFGVPAAWCVTLAALLLPVVMRDASPVHRLWPVRGATWRRWTVLNGVLAGAGALALWRDAPVLGLAVLSLVAVLVVRAACVQGVRIASDVRFRLLRRRHARASLLNDLLELMLWVGNRQAQYTVSDRSLWAYWLERAASALADDLPRQLRAEDPVMQEWVRRNAQDAACALRRLKRQALSPAPGSADHLSAELRRAAAAVASGCFARLRLVREPERPRPGWRTYVQAVARGLAVTGLPILAVVASRPLLGLGEDAYRTALLVSGGWAALYLLLVLDPGLREKIDTARGLLTASGAPGKPDDPRPDRQP